MRFRKFWVRPLFVSLCLLPAVGHADRPLILTPPPIVQEKHVINNAIQISVTPRGMGYFSTGLDDVLASQGISLEQGYFPGFSWEADRSYKIDDLSLSEEQRNTLNMVKNLLSKWLVGFSFNEFRPTIQVGDLGYMAKFNKFSLVSDRALLLKLGKTTGAVLAIELEISKLTAVTEQIRASDQNNQWLGQVGADGTTLGIGSAQNPLKVRLPFYIRINEKQELEFQAVEVSSNLDTVDMELKYKKLVVPQVAIEVNGHRFEMNQKQLETEVQDRMPEILQQAKSFLKKFATEQLPALLNEKSKTLLSGGLEELNRMDPVGADKDPCLAPAVPFIWGIKPEKDGLSDNGSLQFRLNAFVEDPKNPKAAIQPSRNARGPLNLSLVSPATYDIALAIDRGFINRMLQLSYARGVFNNIPIDKSDPKSAKMDLTMQPEFGYYPAPAGAPQGADMTYLKMMTKARIQKGFLKGFKQKLALKEPFEVSLGVIVKMMKNRFGQIQLYYYGVDPESVNIDSQYLTGIGSLFDETVRKQAVSALEEVAVKWRQNYALVSEDPLPIPQEIGGIRLVPERIVFAPSGHLVMYMTYAKPGSPLPPVVPPKKCLSPRGGR